MLALTGHHLVILVPAAVMYLSLHLCIFMFIYQYIFEAFVYRPSGASTGVV